MSLAELPVELVSQILSLAILYHPTPSYILCVNADFYSLGWPLLYAHLRFRSTSQIKQFYYNTPDIRSPARSISVSLAGGEADYELFHFLRLAVAKCKSLKPDGGQLDLDVLHLRLNSHTRDPNLDEIEASLSLTSPKEFSWTGPDPDHHFSIAIVPSATVHLFRAFGTWRNIRHIKLTNISFPAFGLDSVNLNIPDVSLFPAIPSLLTVYLGQTTFLAPSSVAAMVLSSGMENLERVTLVDAYRQSIWGLRVRRSDIEKAVFASARSETEAIASIGRIRRLVTCQKKTERITGGDRVEGTMLLN